MKTKFLISLLVISLLAVYVVAGFWPFTGDVAKNTKTTKQAFECKETDVGHDDFTAGVAVSSQDNKVKIDTCSANVLKEYSCQKTGKVAGKNVRCAGGCEQKQVYFNNEYYNADQCVSLCSDSDEGFVLNKRGTVTTPFAEVSDYCVDEKTVMEMSCAEKSKDKWRVSKSPISDFAKIIARERKCGKNEVCRGGACVKKTESTGILIEKDFGSLKFLGLRSEDNCDIVYYNGACKLHVGYYGIGQYSSEEPKESDMVVLAGVETHTEKFSNTEAIKGILQEFARGENVDVGGYDSDGRNYITIRTKENEQDIIFIGWYSGTNIVIAVVLEKFEGSVKEDDIKRLVAEYQKKYPSDLQPFKPENLCVDTDWNDQYKAGSVIDGNGQYKDACVVPDSNPENGFYAEMDGVRYDAVENCSGDDCFVAESTCNNERQEFVKLKCEFGYSCKSGKCVNNLQKGECFDSDGKDFLNKGYGYGYWWDRPAEDSCGYTWDERTGESKQEFLFEYYCEKSVYGGESYLTSTQYDCAEEGKTCVNGACGYASTAEINSLNGN